MYLPKKTLRIKLFGKPLIITAPEGRPFGPMLAGIHIPLAVAAAEGAALVVLWPLRCLNRYAFDVASPDAPIVCLKGGIAACLRAPISGRENLTIWAASVREFVSLLPIRETRDLCREMGARPWFLRRTSKERWVFWKRLKLRRKAWHLLRKTWAWSQVRKKWEEGTRQGSERRYRLQVYHGHDLRDVIARRATKVTVTQKAERRARAIAQRIGFPLEGPVVTLHVRESGYRPAYTGHLERLIDFNRSARIQDYERAVAELVTRGFTVVRIGDPTMTPFSRPGVIDLATWPDRDSQPLQLWCVARSHFFLASESGPSELGLLFGVPMLQVNVVNFQSNYPIRPADRCILKLATRPDAEALYSLEEMAQPSFIHDEESLEQRRYLDNSPEDLLLAVREMLDNLARPQPPSPSQTMFGDLVATLYQDPRNISKFTKKLGRTHAHIGEGFICRFFADRYLRTPALAPTGLSRMQTPGVM